MKDKMAATEEHHANGNGTAAGDSDEEDPGKLRPVDIEQGF